MKYLVGAAVAMFAFCGQAIAAPALPEHIMSLALCTDHLLMDLVPASRIASVSYLSREKAALTLWPQAARLPVNHNTAEEVLATRPDLVVTLQYTSDAIRPLLEKAGIKVLTLPEPENFPQIRAVTFQLADAVGARPRAQALIAKMDERLARLAVTKPNRIIRVAGWGGGGYVPGGATLFNAVVAAAGGRNIAGPDGGYYDVEALLAAKPDVLLYGDDYIDSPSLRDDQNDHPVLLHYFAHRRIVYPSALLGCGTPESARAAQILRRQLLAAMARPGGVP